MVVRKVKFFSAKDAARCIIKPSQLDHKYSRGVLGTITGSARYPGAAVLTTSAAAATGVGMVRFLSNSGLAHLVLHQTPEVVVQPGPVNAWLAGSGVELNKYRDYTTWLRHRWFTTMKNQSVPTVLDAGALSLAGLLQQPTLITPHPGELSRLLQRRGIKVSAEAVEANPLEWAERSSYEIDCAVLIKGAHTVAAYKDYVIKLPKSSSWLATAGTGDVLAGIVGALTATNYIEILNSMNRFVDVAATGAFIHNQAALISSNGAPISASSLITEIPTSIRKILN